MRRRSTGWSGDASLYSLILGSTWALQAAAILLGLMIPPLIVAPLHFQEQIIDAAIPSGDRDLLFRLAAFSAAAVVMTSAVKFAVTFLRSWIAEIVSRVLRAALIDRQRHRRPAEARSALGDVTSVLTAEVDPLGGFAAEALNTPLIQGGALIGVIGFMVVAEPRLAIVGVAALVAEAVLTPILQERINRLTQSRITTLRGAGRDMIRAADPAGRRRILGGLVAIRRTYWIRIRMNILKSALKVARNLIDHSADIAVLVAGAVMVMQGETQTGVIVAFLSGLRALRDPWGELVDFYRRLVDARVKHRLVRAAMSEGRISVLAPAAAG